MTTEPPFKVFPVTEAAELPTHELGYAVVRRVWAVIVVRVVHTTKFSELVVVRTGSAPVLNPINRDPRCHEQKLIIQCVDLQTTSVSLSICNATGVIDFDKGVDCANATG